ncbi:hypothetical protein DQ04_00491120 [Trypanosoma grayi]|uniref:hypothetical protein n=1 Tax=Trypanosoma grayi TaxID=71804 RepID=UPI0004F444E8|nr:hypothetical protein DQ04_00491120 [Trypanosoma grayi]KEG14392.1 hypothetical protein DQ04_00491120 [Trypanosoma grayi]
MATVLGAEATEQLSAIRRVASALRNASLSSCASFHADEGVLTVSENPGESTAAVLRDVGHTLATAADAFVSAVELQLAEFFNHMRDTESTSAVELLKKRTLVPAGFTVVTQTEKTADFTTPTSRHNTIAGRCASKVPQNAPLALRRYDRQAAATALQTCLFVMIESVLTRVNATRAAVYINDTAEDPHVLCRVAHIHGEEKLPPEVSYANTSTLVTVVRDGLAVNFDTTHASRQSHTDRAETPRRPFEGHARYPLHVRSGVVVPISNYGCILVADKPLEAPQFFTPFDEHQVWAIATLCEGLFARYPQDLFLEMQWNPAQGVLRQCSLLPHIKVTQQYTAFSAPCPEDDSEPTLDALKSVPRKLTIMRATGDKISVITDASRMPHKHLTYDGLFQEAGGYIKNIELLWQKSLSEINTLQLTITEQARELNAKKSRIAALESEMRRLHTRPSTTVSR